MPDVEIRRARAEDLDALRTVLTPLHDAPPWEVARDEAATAALREIVSDDRRALFLAFVDGEAAGTLDVIVNLNLTRNCRPFAVIENVVVVPAFRRGGVGRRLMEAGLAFAEQRGCYKAQLVSANKRDAAHHLYRAMGFDAAVAGYRRYLVPVSR